MEMAYPFRGACTPPVSARPAAPGRWRVRPRGSGSSAWGSRLDTYGFEDEELRRAVDRLVGDRPAFARVRARRRGPRRGRPPRRRSHRDRAIDTIPDDAVRAHIVVELDGVTLDRRNRKGLGGTRGCPPTFARFSSLEGAGEAADAAVRGRRVERAGRRQDERLVTTVRVLILE